MGIIDNGGMAKNVVYHLLYRSVATGYVSPEVVKDILSSSKKNNSKLNVSGLLVCRASHFIQLLEGEKSSVIKIYEVIAKDSRHAGTKIIMEFESEAAIFAGWSMGYIQDDKVTSELSQAIDQIGVPQPRDGAPGSKAVVAILKKFNERELGSAK